MPNWLYQTQQALGKLHPEFVKCIISIMVSATIFTSAYFSTNDALEYISRKTQWIILGIMGLGTVVLNQTRDGLSAYWKDKRGVEKINELKNSGDTVILNKQ